MITNKIPQPVSENNLHPDRDPFEALEAPPRESPGAYTDRMETETWDLIRHGQPRIIRTVVGGLNCLLMDIGMDRSATADQMRAILAETIERIEREYPDRSKQLRATLAVEPRQ